MYRPRGRNYTLLIALAAAALVYGGVLFLQHTLTGRSRVDGSIGVVLGLYICSQPAANLVDMVLFGHAGSRYLLGRRALLGWLALNALVLFLGCSVVIAGATRFASAGR